MSNIYLQFDIFDNAVFESFRSLLTIDCICPGERLLAVEADLAAEISEAQVLNSLDILGLGAESIAFFMVDSMPFSKLVILV